MPKKSCPKTKPILTWWSSAKNKNQPNTDHLLQSRFDQPLFPKTCLNPKVPDQINFSLVTVRETSFVNKCYWNFFWKVAFLLFYFGKELWRLSHRAHAFCWTKTDTLMKTKQNRKCQIPHTVLERRTLCFSSYKNQIKSKTVMGWSARKKKRSHYLYRLLCPKEIFST